MSESASLLPQIYRQHLLEINTTDDATMAETVIENAVEAAIKLLFMAGFDAQDSDHFGDEMGDSAQTLLTMVMMRCPELATKVLDASNAALDD